MDSKNGTIKGFSWVMDWFWFVGVVLILIGVGMIINLLVAQSHPTGLVDAITPTALLWLGGGLLIILLSVVFRSE
jgi:hypothetical protein